MEEKVLKKIVSTCPFPLLIYKTNIKYNEVKKASGIAYILLDLFQKATNKDETIAETLLRFGIPTELHYIFGREIERLLSTDIVESPYRSEHFSTPKYFSEIRIADVKLTKKGQKLFREGAIPTGEEKVKTKDIYFSPVTRKFDVASSSSYTTIASSFLGESFMDTVEVDISNMGDYINSNVQKLGLKSEERVISYETEEPQVMITRQEDGMTIIIRPSGAEFYFETSDERAFFNKYFNVDLMKECMRLKVKYKFVGSDGKELSGIPTVNIEDIGADVQLHIPADYSKQAAHPCRIFVQRGRLSFDRKDNVIVLPENEAERFLNILDSNAECALFDASGIKYYLPVNMSMPCSNFAGRFEMQLLIEKAVDEGTFASACAELFDFYKAQPLQAESAKAIIYLADNNGENNYLSEYADYVLSRCDGVDEKITALIKLNTYFLQNAKWQNYIKTVGESLFNESVAEVKLDNMIYKNTILEPLKGILSIQDGDYIQRFAASVLGVEEDDLVFEALEAADFPMNLILGVVNVVPNYMQNILQNTEIVSDSDFSDPYKNIRINLWRMNEMLGIKSTTDYTLREDYNEDEFFNLYSTLMTTYKQIESYKHFAVEEYGELAHYLKLYEPIHELLSIERTSASHPDQITVKYIDGLLVRGKYKEAICDLLVKLQYDLRNILGTDRTAQANELIDLAKDDNIVTAQEASALHKLRICRNAFQHPDSRQAVYNAQMIEQWKNIVFSIGGDK